MAQANGNAGFQADALLDQYFHEIESSKGVPAEQETKLAKAIKEGDEEAFQILVTANLRFVVSVAKQHQNLGLPLSDLINEGNLGLMVAAKRFDGTKGFKFISYAVWWIRQAILQALAEKSRIVRLPLNRIGELTRINKVILRLGQRLGRPPEIDEIAAELEQDPEELDQLLSLARRPISLEVQMDEAKKDSKRLGDILVDESAPDPTEEVLADELRMVVGEAIEYLNEGEQRILRMYYGLNGQDAMTLEEIGAHIGRTRERVRQIKEKVLLKLRHPTRSEALLEHYDNKNPARLSGKKLSPRKSYYQGGSSGTNGHGATLPVHWTPEKIQERNRQEAALNSPQAKRVVKARQSLLLESGQDPGPEVVALETGLDIQFVKDAYQAQGFAIS